MSNAVHQLVFARGDVSVESDETTMSRRSHNTSFVNFNSQPNGYGGTAGSATITQYSKPESH